MQGSVNYLKNSFTRVVTKTNKNNFWHFKRKIHFCRPPSLWQKANQSLIILDFFQSYILLPIFRDTFYSILFYYLENQKHKDKKFPQSIQIKAKMGILLVFPFRSIHKQFNSKHRYFCFFFPFIHAKLLNDRSWKSVSGRETPVLRACVSVMFPCLEEVAERFLKQKLNKLNGNVLLHTASIPPWLS